MSTSVFDQNSQNVEADDDNNVGDVNHFEELVGEGKKYKDVEALAKAYAHLDRQYQHVTKTEMTGLRNELDSRLALEELVEKLSSAQTHRASESASNNSHHNEGHERRDDDHGTRNQGVLTREEIAELVRQSLTEEQTKKSQEANLNRCANEMKKAWGPDYVSQLRTVQKTLGVSDETLDHLAKTSPELFLNAVVGNTRIESPSSFSAPRSQVNTTASAMRSGNSSLDREYNELSSLMKTNPSRYWSKEVQNRLMAITEQRMKSQGVL